MERTIAIKKLSGLLGKNLGYRVNDKAPTADERAAAQAELVTALAVKKELDEKKNARYRAILAGDQEYQALHAAYMAAKKHTDELSSITRSYKFTVGVSNSMFFHIKAEGDSWEDVIRKVSSAR